MREPLLSCDCHGAHYSPVGAKLNNLSRLPTRTADERRDVARKLREIADEIDAPPESPPAYDWRERVFR